MSAHTIPCTNPACEDGQVAILCNPATCGDGWSCAGGCLLGFEECETCDGDAVIDCEDGECEACRTANVPPWAEDVLVDRVGAACR